MKNNRLRSKFSLLLALIISAMSVCSVFAATYYQDGDWKFEKPISEQGVYYVAGYTGTADKIQIPALFQKYPVTKINNNTFLNKTNLTYIDIPATIEYIGMNAFYGCDSLESISIPALVAEIGPNAFYGCSSLSSLNFKDDAVIKEISHNSFNGCTSLESVKLPTSITAIGARAFLNCTSLEQITISPFVKEIEKTAFNGCANLTIYGWNDTFAQQYAADNTIPFVNLGDYEYPTEPTEPDTSENTTPTESVPDTEPEPGTTPIIPDTKPTESDATEPTSKYPEGKKYLIGDSDISGAVTVKDATLIQKHAAELVQLDNLQRFLANCNGEGDVNVKDATQIQKYCAGFKNIRFVGTEVTI